MNTTFGIDEETETDLDSTDLDDKQQEELLQAAEDILEELESS